MLSGATKLSSLLASPLFPLGVLPSIYVLFSLLLPHYSPGFHIFPLSRLTPLGFPNLYLGILPSTFFPNFWVSVPLPSSTPLSPRLTFFPPSQGPHSSKIQTPFPLPGVPFPLPSSISSGSQLCGRSLGVSCIWDPLHPPWVSPLR